MSARKPPPGVTIDQAFQTLQKNSDGPHMACEQLNTALRTGRVKLFADGAEVNPSISAGHLLVTAAEEDSGSGWVAKMTALRALARPSYAWTVTGVNELQ